MEFLILGQLEVRDGGEPVQLGGSRQKAVLALLLTRANEVVSKERLIDEIWGEEPPESANNSLQVQISQLRKSLGKSLIETRPPGYVISIDPDRLDLSRFERLLNEGREALARGEPTTASSVLTDALELWRGPPLADFAYESFAEPEISRLEELRLTALELRIEADLSLGRHVELVGELELLVAQHPLRERLRADLMLALYRAGRQAEALQTYQDGKRLLAEELGIDPGQALQELERSILRQDETLGGASKPTSDVALRPLIPTEVDVPEPERSILVLSTFDQNLGALLALAERLAVNPPRELILARLVATDDELLQATQELQSRRASLLSTGVASRAAAFTSTDPGDDALRLVSEQDVDLLLIDVSPDLLGKGLGKSAVGPVLESSPCDVGILVVRDGRVPEFGSELPVLVPFGGADHDWTAVELGAWIAGSTGAALRLLGTIGDPGEGKRDASRLLASASLMVQQMAHVVTEPVLVEPGEREVISAADETGIVVVGLSPRWRQEGIGPTRLAVARLARPPTLFVRRGLRPGGLAPRDSLTRFTWTIATGQR